VVVVPFEVPVRTPVKVRVVPVAADLIVRLKGPVTCPVEPVVRVTEPDSVSAFKPVAKHGPSLKNEKPVRFNGPVLFTEKETTKFSKADWLLEPPVSCPSQKPLVDVVAVVEAGVLLPQPHTASSSASTNRIASFFMYLPDFGVTTRIERCGQSRQWM
jgi:hypothetical protein